MASQQADPTPSEEPHGSNPAAEPSAAPQESNPIGGQAPDSTSDANEASTIKRGLRNVTFDYLGGVVNAIGASLVTVGVSTGLSGPLSAVELHAFEPLAVTAGSFAAASVALALIGLGLWLRQRRKPLEERRIREWPLIAKTASLAIGSAALVPAAVWVSLLIDSLGVLSSKDLIGWGTVALIAGSAASTISRTLLRRLLTGLLHRDP
jgi:hypothetical protein